MPDKGPNILLLTTDQQRYDTIAALGNRHIRTPALDRLCAEGTAFRRAYCTNPLCSPSRASILTGLMPSQHRCWNVGVGLPEDARTLPSLLRSAGYTSAVIGKVHLQPCLQPGSPEAAPRIFDFDHFRRWRGPYYGFEACELAIGHTREPHAAGMHYGLWLRDRGVDVARYFGGAPSHELGEGTGPEGRWALPQEHHNSRWVADRAIHFLRQQVGRDGSFFLWASFQDPHMPFVAPSPWFDIYAQAPPPLPAWDPGELDTRPVLYRAAYEGWFPRLGLGDAFGAPGFADLDHRAIPPTRARQWTAAYYAMIALLDHHTGRILDALDELGLSRNTLVVFTSDHGEFLGHHGLWGKGPFHLEDLLRVPLIARWPGVVPGGRCSSALQSLADLTPTFLAAACVPLPAGLAGINQLPVWTGNRAAGRSTALVENRVSDRLYVKTVITDRHKLTVHLPGDEGELYDMEADAAEEVNLWSNPAHGDLARHMLCTLLAADAALEPPAPPRSAYA